MKTLDTWLQEFDEYFVGGVPARSLPNGEVQEADSWIEADPWQIKDFLSTMYREVREELIAKLQEENRQRSIAIWCEDDSSEHKDGYAKRCNELQEIINNL